VIPLVESFRRELAATAEVALAKVAGPARDEVLDALLRLHALVQMIVSREHDVHAVAKEHRLEHLAQRHARAMIAAGGVERVMEVADFPLLRGVPELGLEPVELLA
jgi:hypothetical protein